MIAIVPTTDTQDWRSRSKARMEVGHHASKGGSAVRALDSTDNPLPFFLAAGFSAGELDAAQYRGQVVSIMERTTCIVALQQGREIRRVTIPSDASGIWTCKL